MLHGLAINKAEPRMGRRSKTVVDVMTDHADNLQCKRSPRCHQHAPDAPQAKTHTHAFLDGASGACPNPGTVVAVIWAW